MTESPESEITRVLATWPESERLAGVLRVVRAMQERVDEARQKHAEYKAWAERVAGAFSDLDDAVALTPAQALAALANEEKARGAAGSPTAGRNATDMPNPERQPSPEPLLALADEILNAWHDHRKCVSVEGERLALARVDRAIAAYDAARASAARPEPDREERADAGPHVVHLQGHGTSETVETATVVDGPCTMWPAEEGIGPHPPARPSLKFGREKAELLKSLHDEVPDDPDEEVYPPYGEARVGDAGMVSVQEMFRRVSEVESRLPDGMKDCTIVLRHCALGHAWLTATNWVDHGCPTCAIETAVKRADALPVHKQNWRGVCPACRREVIMEVESYANQTSPQPEVKP